MHSFTYSHWNNATGRISYVWNNYIAMCLLCTFAWSFLLQCKNLCELHSSFSFLFKKPVLFIDLGYLELLCELCSPGLSHQESFLSKLLQTLPSSPYLLSHNWWLACWSTSFSLDLFYREFQQKTLRNIIIYMILCQCFLDCKID